MAHRDIIVVGASLGGVEAIPRLAATLPADLPAAVLVVQHMQEGSPSYLPELIRRGAAMRFAAAVDGEPIRAGRGYVSVPDHHLMVQDGRIRLSRGPRESHARPAIDVLFRSAAHEYGPRAIGVVLTGLLDDGTAGLWAIKDRGGVSIVQSPGEAASPQMPLNALKYVDVDHTVDIADMAPLLERLTAEDAAPGKDVKMTSEEMKAEIRIARGEGDFRSDFASLGEPSSLTCPECHGSMRRIREGPHRRFRCHTGHAFGEDALESTQNVSIEMTLTQALALLEEQELLLQGDAAGAGGAEPDAGRRRSRIADIRRIGARLRALIDEVAPKS